MWRWGSGSNESEGGFPDGGSVNRPGRLRPAPENFLTEEQIGAVAAGRRDFLRKGFLAAGAALAAPMAAGASEGDPVILKLQEWPTSLGQPVAARPYAIPSQFESQVIRRVSPGPVSYTHLRAHETVLDLVCRLLLEKKNKNSVHAPCFLCH